MSTTTTKTKPRRPAAKAKSSTRPKQPGKSPIKPVAKKAPGDKPSHHHAGPKNRNGKNTNGHRSMNATATTPTITANKVKPICGPKRYPQITGSTIGERVKSARLSLKIRQIPLAEATGLSQGYICDLEGGNKSPSISTMQVIAAALNTTVGRLLGEGK